MSIERLNEVAPPEFAKALTKELREELNRNKGDWARLAKLSQGRFSHSWVISFAGGRIRNPHLSMIVLLAMYLGIQFQVKPTRHFNQYP